MSKSDLPAAVLDAWDLHDAQVEPITVGLINRTYDVRPARGERLVVQRLHDLFGPEVNHDLDAVTAHVAGRGRPTPRLVRTRAGEPFVLADGTWRAITFLSGRVFASLPTPALAHGAGALLGDFLAVVSDFDQPFRSVRGAVHDTPRHLERLRTVLTTHTSHPAFAQVQPLGESLLAHARGLEALPVGPPRVLHGDPKSTNLLFHPERDEGLAMLDLDTLARGQLAVEVGDALRSWCNPSGEDAAHAALDPALAEGALTGLAVALRETLTPEERAGLVLATETIALELAVRFCVDALEESRWHHDPQRFATRSEHNQARSRGQFALARSVQSSRGALERVVQRAFG